MVEKWRNNETLNPQQWTCHYCDSFVGSRQGYIYDAGDTYLIYICPNCFRPSFYDFQRKSWRPGSLPGTSIPNVPKDLADLYEEARLSAGASAYTAAVMICRKMLMNIAVQEGAKEGLRFVQYIEYLENNHYFSPKSKDFVVYIKDLGNEANHEIAPKTRDDALAVIDFVGALLSHNYDLPSKVPSKNPPTT